MLTAARPAARLGAVALTAAALAATAAPAFAAASASPAPVTVPAGLYGKSDPTYDGVWRQGLSLIALHTQGVTPAASAISWLTGQQCADGGWPSYNADPAKGCTPATEDTNATSVAVQALVALGGHDAAVGKAVAWYKKVQNADGGWSDNPGTPSDGNSTGLVVAALTAAGTAPASVARNGKTGLDGLHSSGKEHLTMQLAGSAPGPDFSSTGWAVLSLANNGRAADAERAAQWLSSNGVAWAQGNGTPSPSALATLVLDASATGLDAHHFGGADLVAALEATGPAPAATAAASAAASAPAAAAKTSSSSFSPWWIIGVGLVAGAGIGIFISISKSKRR